MERKTEDFFDGDKLSISKVMTQLSQHPDKMDKILEYVVWKVKHFTEFHTKKEHLKEDYDRDLEHLYGEYMKE